MEQQGNNEENQRVAAAIGPTCGYAGSYKATKDDDRVEAEPAQLGFTGNAGAASVAASTVKSE